MGFDIYGQAPKSAAGEYFRNNVWWWRPLQVLIDLTCADILTEDDLRELGFNDGYAYSAEKVAAIASRLSDIAADEKQLARYKQKAMALLPEVYQECWSKENILVQFVAHCEAEARPLGALAYARASASIPCAKSEFNDTIKVRPELT